MISKKLAECISARSILIWEREGRPEGLESEIWERARLEIEDELRAALDGQAGFVPPRLEISMRPKRHAA